MKIICIAAIAHDGAMGVNGVLPWHCPADLRHFKALTVGRVCLMGRKTAAGLRKPLRDRVNLVLTRDRSWSKTGFTPVYDMRGVKKILKDLDQEELWVIGGAEIYRRFLPKCDLVHLTVLDITVPNADTWFPVQALGQFQGVYAQTVVDPRVVFWTLHRTPTPTKRLVPKTQRAALVDRSLYYPNWIMSP